MTDNEIFGLLSEPVRRFVYNKGWRSFRPIQRAAIERIMGSSGNFILASRTASGKTEAAFLPVLSKCDFLKPGVRVLYISPLIALINDQMRRVEELCRYMDVPVTKWHGEASQAAKRRLLAEPRGVVLITPESIEAMMCNHPENVALLFRSLDYVIVDEIHYFIGTDRGVHLQSLLTRLRMVHKDAVGFSLIGLSATIGDFALAKLFTGDEAHTAVLLDPARKQIDADFGYYGMNGEAAKELPLELIKDIYRAVHDNKSLVFPNSRGHVEEIAAKLKRVSELVGGHDNIFSHHASVDRDVREYVEFFAKNSVDAPFAICCTSTLELGIDIGSVDLIVQVNATHSVWSLIQRAGRSGRSEGKNAALKMFSTDPMSLLRSLACWNLHERGEIEAPEAVARPYDVMLHQMLSIIKQHTEITPSKLAQELTAIPVFCNISRFDISLIVTSLLEDDKRILELVGDKLIVGVEGERIVNRKDFYSVFISENNMQVVCDGRRIGELQPGPDLAAGKRIMLAAQVWVVDNIDYQRRRITVSPAADGKPPRFSSSPAIISGMIEQEMLAVLRGGDVSAPLDAKSAVALNGLRKEFSELKDGIMPMRGLRGGTELHVYFGTRANRGIALLLSIAANAQFDCDDNTIFVPYAAAGLSDLVRRAVSLGDEVIAEKLQEFIIRNSSLIRTYTKYGHLLPLRLQADVLLQKVYDVQTARQVLSEELLSKENPYGVAMEKTYSNN